MVYLRIVLMVPDRMLLLGCNVCIVAYHFPDKLYKSHLSKGVLPLM